MKIGCQGWGFVCKYDAHIDDRIRNAIQCNTIKYIAYVRTGDGIEGYAYKDRPMGSYHMNEKIFFAHWRAIHIKLPNDDRYMELLTSGTLIEFGTRPYQTREVNKRKRDAAMADEDAVDGELLLDNLKLQLNAANAETVYLATQLDLANAETANLKRQLGTVNVETMDLATQLDLANVETANLKTQLASLMIGLWTS
jgi:hypothetical protein